MALLFCQWSTVNGQRSMVNGQWSMVNGQRSIVNGQWSTVNSQKNFQLSIPYKLYTLHSTLSTLHFIWAFRRSRRAFRYIFARSLAKDAAPIPNAWGDGNDVFFIRRIILFHKAMPYAVYVSPFQGS